MFITRIKFAKLCAGTVRFTVVIAGLASRIRSAKADENSVLENNTIRPESQNGDFPNRTISDEADRIQSMAPPQIVDGFFSNVENIVGHSVNFRLA